MSIIELAKLITRHLNRFEKDPEINAVHEKSKRSPYYEARAYKAGCKLGIVYISYQGRSTLSKADGELYLAWLNAGNVGKHFAWQETKNQSKGEK